MSETPDTAPTRLTEVVSASTPRLGRRPVTTRAEIEAVALDLFATRGFDETTVDDIAAAAGIGRRTFFRYYAAKTDIVWGDFEAELHGLRRYLDDCPADVPMMSALHDAVLSFNRFAPEHAAVHRRRMELILRTPALIANSTLRYTDWRAVVAEFVGRRVRQPAEDLLAQLISYAALGAALAAYEQWLRDPDAELMDLLGESMTELARGFAGHEAMG